MRRTPRAPSAPALPAALLAGLLVACAAAPAAPPPLVVQGEEGPSKHETTLPRLEREPLVGLAGGPLVVPELGTCTVPQPYGFSGTTGRVELALGPKDVAPTRVGADHAADGVLGPILRTDPSEPVGVLVVDRFDDGAFPIDDFDLAHAGPILDRIGRQELPHGLLVWNHLNGVIAGTGLYARDDRGGGEVAWRRDGGDLLVRAVDYRAGDSAALAAALADALDRFAAEGIERAVVNLSFAMVPCSVVRDYEEVMAEIAGYDEYVRALFEANGDEIAAQLPAASPEERRLALEQSLRVPVDDPALLPSEPGASDPLYRLIEARREAIFVAAAGNFDHPFPTFPAAWQRVVSVGAHVLGAPSVPAPYANAAEVAAAGGHLAATFAEEQLYGGGFALELLDPAEPGRASYGRVEAHYAGTSFAAPAVSAFSAIDLATGTPRCGAAARPFPSGTITTPRLAHGALTGEDLAAAAAAHCP